MKLVLHPPFLQTNRRLIARAASWLVPRLFVPLVFVPLALCAGVTNSWSQEVSPTPNHPMRKSDGMALGTIFDEQPIREGGLWAVQRAAMLDPSDRYEFLADWVIPGKTHPTFRVTTDYASATHELSGEAKEPAAAEDPSARIISPALDLVRLAKKLDKSETLRQAILEAPATNVRQRCDQTSLLILLAIELGDDSEATRLFDELFKQVLGDPVLLDQVRQGVLLCVDRASEASELWRVVREPIGVITQNYRTEYDRKAWHRYLGNAYAKVLKEMQRHDSDAIAAESRSEQWIQATRETAFEHGSAFPEAHWQFVPGSVRSLSSYGDDFLFFVSPLRGDYSVEGEATGFGYREAHLMDSGYWIGLAYTHEHIMIGNVRGELRRPRLDAPLTDTHSDGFIHTHVRNRDGVSEIILNGRPVYRRTLEKDPDPWVAIRSNYRVQGGFDGLTITGTPTIPETISLVESSELLGWYDYYQRPGGNPGKLAGWSAQVAVDSDGNTLAEVRDPRSAALPAGCDQERLLVYSRPVREDGTIEYEFWYEQGKTLAHPALGRRCFLLTPDGVRLHHITDGTYDRSSLRPDNGDAPQTAAAQPLPLKNGAWNQLQLRRQGDQVALTLNGHEILVADLEPASTDPRFGLFHFADRSELRVRGLRWAGDWPKKLPPIEEQVLAGELPRLLAWSPDKPSETLVHDFDEQSVADGSFAMVLGDPAVTMRATDEGLVVRQESQTGYRGALVAPTVSIGGDFDVTVDYDRFECECLEDKIGAVRLHLQADNDAQDLALIQRVDDRSGDQRIQCLRMGTVAGQERRHYFGRRSLDAAAGRLRLSRRGTTVYYLTADQHSDQFRLIGKEEYVSDDLKHLGIQFGTQIQGPSGQTSVRFTHFELRAERIAGMAALDPETVLAELKTHRDNLPDSFEHDFATEPPGDDLFYRWADRNAWDEARQGLELKSEGTDNWTSAGLSLRRQFEGDFEVSFEFEPIELATPKKGKHTQVYLQVELANPDATQLSSILTKSDAGTLVSQSQIRNRAGGAFQYQAIGNQPLADPGLLRIQRRGSDIFFIAGKESDQNQVLLGHAKATNDPVEFFGIRMMLHTGGAERSSRILLKSIQVRAERSVALPVVRTIRTLEQPAPPKSLPTRLFDSVRGLFE
ncbi:DUF1583 domain-containing protein [Roseiconus nitratireducens]|uniref:DUF1583 domain-containing protein n=1 Tax=Roseiconus nitratireducens TaxID=2605748 RepID=A0A5M6CVB2_9BACT|nr:DUF1583 domain-containing protein [Roseiconus nitratireducens]KAA5538983.1 DUF1583 domain-containing protein [Roseiconus nitratireducens]